MKLSDLNSPIAAVCCVDHGHTFCLRFCLDRPGHSDKGLAVIDGWNRAGLLSDVGAVDLLLDFDKAFDDYWKDKT